MQDGFDKLLAGVGGAALVGIFGWLGAGALRDYRTFGDAPLPTDVAGAVVASAGGRQWVTVEAAWRCDLRVSGVDGGRVFLPATADDGALVVARFDRDFRCEGSRVRALTGIVEPMEAKRAADLRAAGLAVPAAAPLRTLDVCTSCGRDNARLGIVVCGCFVLLGLGLYPVLRAIGAARGRATAALHRAIDAPAAQDEAADRTVRTWGLVALVLGALGVVVGKGWAVYRVVPVPWVAAVGMAFGLWMLVSPESYRKVARKGRR